jgi:periplasmic protein TonB
MALALLLAGLALQPAAPSSPPPPAPSPPPVEPVQAPRLRYPVFQDSDFPAAARARHLDGRVSYEVSVDAAGMPVGCRITQTSGYGFFDIQTCRVLLTRARFRPARDAQGRAVPGTYQDRVWWHLPR